MTPELIAAIVGLLLALTGLVKVWTEVARMKADRTETKVNRDRDSLEIHDKILKHDFMIAQLKDQQSLTATVVDDLRDQCAALNSNIVKLDTNIANLTEAVKELKK
jgi:TolA-binding protein